MERRQIIQLWQNDASGVLVTLVRTEGSSYRQPGARLLTAPGSSQQYAGTISGGCLEDEVIRKAGWMVRSGAQVERYSMRFDDTVDIPFGLGCGGVVDLLFEPADSPEAAALLAALRGTLNGDGVKVVTFLPRAASPGSGEARSLRRLVLDAQGAVLFASGGLSAEKSACASRLLPGGAYEGRFVEQLEPPQRLVVFGAGDDARPLVRMAGLLGWSVVVADGRAQLARSDRFPEADRVVALGGHTPVLQTLGLRTDDAVVLMTHSYEQDSELLAAILPLRPRYLGLLGSRHRSSLMVAEVSARLGRSIASCCSELSAPVGLDLGGEGPEAIALAILSEAQAVCHGRGGMRDRLSEDEVERQLAQGGVTPYMQAQRVTDAA